MLMIILLIKLYDNMVYDMRATFTNTSKLHIVNQESWAKQTQKIDTFFYVTQERKL